MTDAKGRYRLHLTSDTEKQAVGEATYSFVLYSPVGLGYVRVESWQGVKPNSHLDLHLQEGDHVSGNVVGYPEGTPLAGVKVQALVEGLDPLCHSSPAVEKTVTDSDGRFRFKTSLPPKQYDVIAAPPGWPTMETKTEPPPSETPSARTIEIRLVKPYTIHGHAYGPDGNPLRKVTISGPTAGFSLREPGMSSGQFGSGEEVTTDEAGAFSYPARRWSSPYTGPEYLNHYQTFVPKLKDGRVTSPAVIDSTNPATYTIDLHFAKPATITGRQVDARTGKPAVGVRAHLIPVVPTLPAEMWSTLRDDVIDEAHSIVKDDETGTFTLRGIAPGEYRLQLGRATIHSLTVENGKAIPVTVKPGETVNIGTVRVVYVPHFRGKLSGLSWKLDPENAEEETHGLLRPSGSSGIGKEGYVDLWAGGGKYTLWATDCLSGTYDAALVASHNNHRYVTQVLHKMALTDDIPREGVNLRFTQGASIRGSVVQAKGKPLPETQVSVRAVSGDALLFNAQSVYGERFGQVMISLGTWTDKKGNFVIDGLLPGTYELTTMAEPIEYCPPQTLRVQVGATEQKRGVVLRTARREVTPAATQSSEFAGTIYLPNGQPARKVTLLALGATHWFSAPGGPSGMGGGMDLGKVVTDAQGRYRVRFPTDWLKQAPEEIVEVTYGMFLYSPDGLGYADMGQASELKPNASLDIHLKNGDQVQGRVVGYPGGQPLADVEVMATIIPPGAGGHGREIVGKSVTDQKGRFQLKTSLPPDRYGLTAKPAGWAMMETKTDPPPSATPTARTVEIRLVRPYTIRGHAYGPDNQPLRKVHLLFDAEAYTPRGPGLSGYASEGGEEVTTDDAGAFALSQKGRYFVYGEGPFIFHYVSLNPRLDGGGTAEPMMVDATNPATHTFDLHFNALPVKR